MSNFSRREFLAAGCSLAALPLLKGLPPIQSSGTMEIPAKAVTSGPKHHFFGYYDKFPWDLTGRYLLAMENDFCDRQPEAGEKLTVGMVDLKDNNRYIPLDETAAWSWQQGTMLQWLGTAPDREIVYNTVTDNQYTATIRDVHTGKTRTLPQSIYALTDDGKRAVTLDYARLHRLRPGYGYATLEERFADDPAPEQLGIWDVDMATGKNQLIINLKELAAFKPDDRFPGAYHWVNHLQYNPSGSRFIFLHRWKQPDQRSWQTRLFTAKADGSDIRLHMDDGMTSHFDWRDDDTILAWARTKAHGDRFYLIDVGDKPPEVVGEGILTRDGHCSYSPDRRWILDDTYPDKDQIGRAHV